ncbi:LysR family transcriptional regulator [Noviherbaspirillum malthae]|jgi:DNA-binding transcriptional LysR family regulator|uniref:LysR family transcriptional regulator n=1 Tax=Noviherbaspirillum malthae TaxID=1260987 RepID=UPI00189006B2|nr:LysR family transcriptional regulator [Noviherbaspirillum malthae]
METKWLEDFICLAETQSFRRAADARHVSQPAFSRRIQALEAWLGAELVDRKALPTRLTPTGKAFYEQALDMLSQINGVRAEMGTKKPAVQTAIDFAAPHTLSLNYMPQWLTSVQKGFGSFPVRLLNQNVHDAVMTMVDGGCDLLLCYHHPRQAVQLDTGRYDMLVLGRETLRPYARRLEDGSPEFSVLDQEAAPLPFLSYSPNTFFGRMIELILRQTRCTLAFDKRYETDMAEGVKMMALQGQGLAFLPESMVAGDVADRLAPADGGRPEWSVQMDIRLYRERPTAQRSGKSTVSRLWTYLADREHTLHGNESMQRSMPGMDTAAAAKQRQQYVGAC